MYKPKRKAWLGLVLSAAVLISAIGIISTVKAATAATTGFYSTSGNRIVDSNGKSAVFNGLNWFGFETANYSPHGLWTRSMDDVLDQIKDKGYNLIRLPYCNQMFDASSSVNSIDYAKNPDLAGLKPIQVMDVLIQKAGARDIQIFLDRHRPDSGGQSELWYTAAYSEERWINDWKMLAERYKNNATVIGADLHNEPHGTASWGSGNTATDWRLASERAGNAILAVNPNWLIIVEGIEKNVQGGTGGYWWGGNLEGAANYPIRLSKPNQLVYSAHDYGPGVASQTWFEDPSFPSNMPAIWDKYWGYISKQNIAPVIAGEFGGRSVDTVSVEGKWQNKLIDYIGANSLYWTYWSLNPNSGDTGGLLLDDWVTWNAPKQAILNRIMQSITSTPTPTPTSTPSTGPTSTPTGEPSATPTPPAAPASLAVQYKNGGPATTDNSVRASVRLVNTGNTSVGLNNITVRYWYTSDGTAAQSFHVDYAQVGTANVLGKFVKLATPKTNADTYLEISFNAAAGSIAAKGTTGDIQFRFNKEDWSNYNLANDNSFDANQITYGDWNKITVYQNGSLIYGIEP
ncbi:MAG: cellulase family glycosylhydrolase [Gorillibacterium sp.]|nr:cellulase family glycosylhydrolase [Gorillibacterium sp.]